MPGKKPCYELLDVILVWTWWMGGGGQDEDHGRDAWRVSRGTTKVQELFTVTRRGDAWGELAVAPMAADLVHACYRHRTRK